MAVRSKGTTHRTASAMARNRASRVRFAINALLISSNVRKRSVSPTTAAVVIVVGVGNMGPPRSGHISPQMGPSRSHPPRLRSLFRDGIGGRGDWRGGIFGKNPQPFDRERSGTHGRAF